MLSFFREKRLSQVCLKSRKSPFKMMASHRGKPSRNNGETGLTLIECLVAIAVIASTIGVIAPITVLSVATRVQNQRAAQASHIAQSEVDRVRLVVERGDDLTLNNIASTTGTLAAVLAPEDINDSAASTSTTAARALDINGDGDNDFAIQVFRTHSTAGVVDGQTVAFDLGVRVYRANSVETRSASDLGTDQASLAMTSGEGQGGTRPLAVLYTTIIKSDEQESLCYYYRYVDATASVPGSCS